MRARRRGRGQPPAGIAFLDGEGGSVELAGVDASAFLDGTAGLDAATVSACPDCRSKVVACVALRDLLLVRPDLPCAAELAELAQDAPTLHLYVVDGEGDCAHARWFDPGHEEWMEASAGAL